MFRKTSAATNDYDALDTMYVTDLTYYLSAVQLKRKPHPRP